MEPEALEAYLKARERIEAHVDVIHSVSSFLSLFDDWGKEEVTVNARALGFLNQLMKQNVSGVIEALDEFIFITDAQERTSVDESS